MTKYSLLVALLIPATIYALPCPNGRGFISKGDSIDEVFKQCGLPYKKETTKTLLSEVKQLVYQRPHAYDPGYTQIVVLFTNDVVSKIHIFERFTYYICSVTNIPSASGITTQTSCGNYDYFAQATNACGAGFGLGANMKYVKSVCGVPIQEDIISRNQSDITKLTYFGTNKQPQILVFQDGKFSEWK